jgi:hypothetical protein
MEVETEKGVVKKLVSLYESRNDEGQKPPSKNASEIDSASANDDDDDDVQDVEDDDNNKQQTNARVQPQLEIAENHVEREKRKDENRNEEENRKENDDSFDDESDDVSTLDDSYDETGTASSQSDHHDRDDDDVGDEFKLDSRDPGYYDLSSDLSGEEEDFRERVVLPYVAEQLQLDESSSQTARAAATKTLRKNKVTVVEQEEERPKRRRKRQAGGGSGRKRQRRRRRRGARQQKQQQRKEEEEEQQRGAGDVVAVVSMQDSNNLSELCELIEMCEDDDDDDDDDADRDQSAAAAGILTAATDPASDDVACQRNDEAKRSDSSVLSLEQIEAEESVLVSFVEHIERIKLVAKYRFLVALRRYDDARVSGDVDGAAQCAVGLYADYLRGGAPSSINMSPDHQRSIDALFVVDADGAIRVSNAGERQLDTLFDNPKLVCTSALRIQGIPSFISSRQFADAKLMSAAPSSSSVGAGADGHSASAAFVTADAASDTDDVSTGSSGHEPLIPEGTGLARGFFGVLGKQGSNKMHSLMEHSEPPPTASPSPPVQRGPRSALAADSTRPRRASSLSMSSSSSDVVASSSSAAAPNERTLASVVANSVATFDGDANDYESRLLARINELLSVDEKSGKTWLEKVCVSGTYSLVYNAMAKELAKELVHVISDAVLLVRGSFLRVASDFESAWGQVTELLERHGFGVRLYVARGCDVRETATSVLSQALLGGQTDAVTRCAQRFVAVLRKLAAMFRAAGQGERNERCRALLCRWLCNQSSLDANVAMETLCAVAVNEAGQFVCKDVCKLRRPYLEYCAYRGTFSLVYNAEATLAASRAGAAIAVIRNLASAFLLGAASSAAAAAPSRSGDVLDSIDCGGSDDDDDDVDADADDRGEEARGDDNDDDNDGRCRRSRAMVQRSVNKLASYCRHEQHGDQFLPSIARRVAEGSAESQLCCRAACSHMSLVLGALDALPAAEMRAVSERIALADMLTLPRANVTMQRATAGRRGSDESVSNVSSSSSAEAIRALLLRRSTSAASLKPRRKSRRHAERSPDSSQESVSRSASSATLVDSPRANSSTATTVDRSASTPAIVRESGKLGAAKKRPSFRSFSHAVRKKM